MRTAIFSTRKYERPFFEEINTDAGHELVWHEARLTPETAALAEGSDCVCAFVNDDLSAPVLERLAAGGVRLVALRSAGFNHVDLGAAARLGLTVARVPAYSPHAVAEHSVALLLALVRKTHKAYNRVREGNFSLEGLLGFDLFGKTVGLVGLGKIGMAAAAVFRGFGCRVLASDPVAPEVEGVARCGLDELFPASDIVSLYCPLMKSTHHMINIESLARMKRGVYLVNTSRGGLIDTRAIVAALKAGHLGGLALDVYEEESELFYEDLSGEVLQDDLFARLLTFPNVIITGHQGFFTAEALGEIARVTMGNIGEFERTGQCSNAVAAKA